MCMCGCAYVAVLAYWTLATLCVWSVAGCWLPVGSWIWLWCCIVGCCYMPVWCLVMSNITYAYLELFSWASCLKWLHVFSRLELPIPDRNRQVPDRYIPFLISRNIGFVFPSAFPVPAPVPDWKIQKQEWFRDFPDCSRPFSTLQSFTRRCRSWHPPTRNRTSPLDRLRKQGER